MDNMLRAVKTVLNSYFQFEGRSGRSEYWWYILAYVIVMVALALVANVISVVALISNLLSLALLIPSIAVGVRRFHDIGKSGWWLLLSLIPVLGWIAVIYFAAQPSVGANAYGEGPQPLAAA